MTDMTDVSVEPKAETTDWLGVAREAFNTSTSYFDANIRKQVESALRQFQGVHPAGSKYHSDAYRTRSRLFRPKTRAAVRRNEAKAAEALFSTRDAVNISAEDDSNQQQLIAAEVMSHLMEYRLKKTIPWFVTAMGAYQDAQVAGVCISYQYWKMDKKRGVDTPCVELLPVENFRWDPGASWMDPVGTSPYLVRMIPMYVKDVRARMTRDAGKKPWKQMTDAQLMQAVQAYNDSTRMTRERGRTDSKEQTTSISSFAIVWVHENIVEMDGEDNVFFTLSTVGQLTDPVPLRDEYWHGQRPFTVGFSVIETHKGYPDGPVGLSKDTQAEVNDTANLRIDNWKYALSRRYFVKRGTQVDLRSLTRNVPGSATLMNDPEKDVKVLDTDDVTSSSFQEQDRLNADFDDVMGSFSTSSVASNRKLNETVGGLNLLSTDSNQVGNYQLRTWVETWVEPTLRQVMLLEAYYEDDQTLLAMAGRRAQGKGFQLSAITDELMQQDLSLAVQVGIGATNPQEKVNNFMLAMNSLKTLLSDGVLERYGLDVEDVVAEIFGHLGYRDGKRFFDKADDPTVQGLLGQVQQLQQALSAKVNPELVAAQIRKMDADTGLSMGKLKNLVAQTVKAYMEAQFAAMQSAEVVTAVPQAAGPADVLLANAGGLPGHQPLAPQPAPGLAVQPIENHKIGTAFTPGAPGASAPGDTSPQTPASPFTGANGGINTMRADS
jgi:hypothetical protein